MEQKARLTVAKTEKADNSEIPKYQVLHNTHYYLLYAEKTNIENGHVINRPVVHGNMPFSAAYSVPYRTL